MKITPPTHWRIALYSRGILISVAENRGYRHWLRIGPKVRAIA